MRTIISIHPEHGENIYRGRKLHELRRKVPTKLNVGEIVFLYETLPIGRITGGFRLAGITSGYPKVLWERVAHTACVSEEAFWRYFGGRSIGYAMRTADVFQLSKPFKPDWKSGKPPQNFCYVHSHQGIVEQLDSIQDELVSLGVVYG